MTLLFGMSAFIAPVGSTIASHTTSPAKMRTAFGPLRKAAIFKRFFHPGAVPKMFGASSRGGLAGKATETMKDPKATYSTKGRSGKGNLHPDLYDALCRQATNELAASNAYLAASFYFQQLHFEGIAKYLKEEADEERSHSLIVFDYIHKRTDDTAVIHEVAQPKQNFEDPLEIFHSLYEKEKEFFSNFKEMRALAQKHGDDGLDIFCQKFIEEQEDEIDKMDALVEKMESYYQWQGTLWHFDKELAQSM
eukprot:CAMPEP_0184492284 /NCGR_PEP_ID=MMETSP0113_2-20130426/22783_1 /TAXON_ID=91329 /ORGANISM="Norrisiella sphaerica, Strain BC52" /LENGTH=249 /DNA_ID=CAMNT_0026876993 /DNA_START=266 /DNA_END=1015 /DNA_ORIENTATION=+